MAAVEQMQFRTENFPRDYKLFVPGGGHGPRTLEEWLLQVTPNVISGASTQDDGGQTGENGEAGLSKVGDIISRMEIHARNENTRKLFRRTAKDMPKFADRRIMNDFLATMAHEMGLIEAVKFFESQLKYYYGQVIPMTNQNTALQMWFDDGTHAVGEKYLDEMPKGHSPLARVAYVNPDFEVTDDYLYSGRTAHGIIYPPGTMGGSRIPTVLHDQVIDMLNKTNVPKIFMMNEYNHNETFGWDPERHVRHFLELGVPITHVIMNLIRGASPAEYNNRGWLRVVNPDEDIAAKQAEAVRALGVQTILRDDLAVLVPFEDEHGLRQIHRHHGDRTVRQVIDIVDDYYGHPRNDYSLGQGEYRSA